jgi:hypothetical protein
MKTLLVTTPRARVKGKDVRQFLPRKLAGWRIQKLPSGALNQTATIPDVTLVQVDDSTQPAELKAMIPGLVHIQAKAPNRSYVMFSLQERGKARLPGGQARQRHFRAVVTQINHELPAFPHPDRVSVTFAQNPSEMAAELDHIRAKLDISDIRPSKATPRPSPLDRARDVLNATEDLRVANGNLSAEAIAVALGVSLSQLAGWLGRTRQALSKTPDADSLQDELAFFERVARLRAVVASDGFLKWLRMPNPELGDARPLDLLAGGERQVVADLVDDMLTGAPA